MTVLIRSFKERQWLGTFVQRLVLLPGASRINPLLTSEDRTARFSEMRALLEEGTPEHERLVCTVERTYGCRLELLVAELWERGRGIDGVKGPALLIDSIGTTFEGGRHRMLNATTTECMLQICSAVGDEFGIDWVGALHVGHFSKLKVVWRRDDASTIGNGGHVEQNSI